MATLTTRGTTYHVNFHDASRTPSRKRLSLKTTSRHVAQLLLEQAEDAYRLGTFDPWLHDINALQGRPAEYARLGSSVDHFLAVKKGENLSPATLSSYRSILHRFARTVHAHAPLERLTASQLGAFCLHRALASSTQRLRYRVLRAFLNWCVLEGHLQASPLAQVSPPRDTERLPRAVRPAHLEAICTAIRADYEAKLLTEGAPVRGACLDRDLVWVIPLFWFGLYTGLRISEIAQLRWQDIDTNQGLIYVEQQKNRKAQTVPLTRRAAQVLQEVERGDEGAYVFHAPRALSTTQRSTKAFTNRVSRIFLRYRRKAGVPGKLTIHGLRHGFCTLLAEAGKSAVVIRAAARHGHISTTMRYIHLANEHLKAELYDVFG